MFPPVVGMTGQSAAAGVCGVVAAGLLLRARLLLRAVASGCGGGGGGGSGDGNEYKRVQKLALTLQWPFGLGRERTFVFFLSG